MLAVPWPGRFVVIAIAIRALNRPAMVSPLVGDWRQYIVVEIAIVVTALVTSVRAAFAVAESRGWTATRAVRVVWRRRSGLRERQVLC